MLKEASFARRTGVGGGWAYFLVLGSMCHTRFNDSAHGIGIGQTGGMMRPARVPKQGDARLVPRGGFLYRGSLIREGDCDQPDLSAQQVNARCIRDAAFCEVPPGFSREPWSFVASPRSTRASRQA